MDQARMRGAGRKRRTEAQAGTVGTMRTKEKREGTMRDRKMRKATAARWTRTTRSVKLTTSPSSKGRTKGQTKRKRRIRGGP